MPGVIQLKQIVWQAKRKIAIYNRNSSFFDKNSLFGGARIGKMGLCVKAKRSATYGGSGLLQGKIRQERTLQSH